MLGGDSEDRQAAGDGGVVERHKEENSRVPGAGFRGIQYQPLDSPGIGSDGHQLPSSVGQDRDSSHHRHRRSAVCCCQSGHGCSPNSGFFFLPIFFKRIPI